MKFFKFLWYLARKAVHNLRAKDKGFVWTLDHPGPISPIAPDSPTFSVDDLISAIDAMTGGKARKIRGFKAHGTPRRAPLLATGAFTHDPVQHYGVFRRWNHYSKARKRNDRP